MILRPAIAAAAALAAAAFAPRAARAAGLDGTERRLAGIEARLDALSRTAARPDEGPLARAERKVREGSAQYARGDWLFASILLADAVDTPELEQAPEYPEALFLLADANRRRGDCAAARPRYQALLVLPPTPRRAAALAGAMACAFEERRLDEVEALAPEAARLAGGSLPPETAYLVAKAIWYRTDLAPADRTARALAAFDAVAPPFRTKALYFEGALRVQQGALDAALERFQACAAAPPEGDDGAAVREQCLLALARVHAEAGRFPEAIAAYRAIPPGSPSFDEALYELAWTYVRAKRFDAALRAATTIAELAPDSPVAPEATILEGHLLLRLGKYAAATEAYNHVINTYAPVRDEIDAILALDEDPMRYFDELIGDHVRALDASALLPPVAVKWARAHTEVTDALRLVGELNESRRELVDAQALSQRIDAAIARSGGVDAFAELSRGWAETEAALNDAAHVEGEAADRELAIAAPALPRRDRAEVERVHAARRALSARFDTLPRDAAGIDARAERMRERGDELEKDGFRLGLVLRGCEAAISGTDRWLDDHRAELGGDPDARQEFAEELRKHRGIVAGYEGDLEKLRLEIARARDAAPGVASLRDEAQVRDEWRALAARERELLRAARGALAPAERAELDRAEALAARAAALRGAAERIEQSIAAVAAVRAQRLAERVGVERAALADATKALDAVQADARELLGKVAYASFTAVRQQFYRIVLKADVGIVDIAWTRKRERLDKVQQLSIQEAAELQQLDQDYRGVLQEAQ